VTGRKGDRHLASGGSNKGGAIKNLHRETQRDTEKHRETQRNTEIHRETQRDTEKHRENQDEALC
jgi:hypothetical protein